MLGCTKSVALVGMDGHPIDVEVSVASGLPAFVVVGLPDPSIQEARERVRAALVAAGETWPQQRITVNLSPADLRKTGSSFDLAIALGILVAVGRIDQARTEGLCFLGELSLDGRVRRVRGVLPATMAAAEGGVRRMMVAPGNAREAAVVRGIDVLPIEHLGIAIRHLRGERDIDTWVAPADDAVPQADALDLADVRGNDAAKRALIVAAAGGHNLLMVGPPGGGKTMLARRIPGVLPPMSEEERFEVTRIHSVAGLMGEQASLVAQRPFRAPHHSGSVTGLVGGGSTVPIPGEVSLAHRGVLFLDEFGEFRREGLQALRQPLEDGHVTIVRSRWSVRFPARIQLIAASNPCPCGYEGDERQPCVCAPGRLTTYRERLTGPVIDRIDLRVDVQRVRRGELFGPPGTPTTASAADEVARARETQRGRLGALRLTCNAEIPPRAIESVTRMERAARRVIENAVETVGLTARGAHRVVRVARTIADLDDSGVITDRHAREALSFRLDQRARVTA